MSNFLNFNGNQGMSFKTFTASGTSYTLDKSASTNSVLVSVGGVMQQPGVDYTVSGNTLTSTSAWTAGVQVDTYIIHKPGTAPTIQDNSIDSDHYVDGSIDLAHMSSQSVDEDNLHISNAGSNGQFLSKQSGDAGGLTWAAAGGGKLVSRYYHEYATATSTTTAIPADDTFPQITEGVQILTITTDTLGSSSNRLRISYGGCFVSSTNGAANVAAVFDGAANALHTIVSYPATGINSYIYPMYGSFEYAPGATTAKTITVRYGNNAGYTMYLNRMSSGRHYEGSLKWVLIVEEIEP